MPYSINRNRKGKYQVRNPNNPTHLFSKGTTLTKAEKQVNKLGMAYRLHFV
jgi:hypothetical protein